MLHSAVTSSPALAELGVYGFEEFLEIKKDFHLVTAVSILVFAFSIQFMTFPTYVELERRSTSRYATVSIISNSMYAVAFVLVAIIGVLLFGEEISPDLISNISMRAGKVSVMLRIAYCLILLLHIPYYFFTIKEYTLVIFDECVNRSMSQHLEMKLAESVDKKDEEEEQLVKQPKEIK